MNIVKPFILLGFTCMSTLSGFSQGTILAWQTEAGVQGDFSSTTTHSLLKSGVLSRGEGMIYNNSSTYSYTGIFPRTPKKEDAVSGNAYYQLLIQAKEGAFLSLSSLTARLRRASATAAKSYRWRYSVNGTDFYDLGDGDVTLPDDFPATNNGLVQNAIDLSNVCDLQHVSSDTQIILRLYAWGGTAESASSNLGFGKSYFSGTPNNSIEIAGLAELPVPKAPILAWQPPSGVQDALPATIADANFLETSLARGPGLTYSSSSTYTYTSNFPVTTSKTEAVSANAFYEVSLKAKPGYYINLEALTSRIRRSHAEAPHTYRWAYSLNGTDFTDVGTADVKLTMVGGNDTNGEDQYVIDLASIAALQNVPSTGQIIFRFYAWGGKETSPNLGFGKSYVGGTVSTDYNALAFYGSILDVITPPGVLPVKISSFRGKAAGKAVKLNWETASEQNNARFQILHSSADKRFDLIGEVKGKGTSNTVNSYYFIDDSPFTGINYYQLRQVDLNGESELSDILAVNTRIEDPAFTVSSSGNRITVQVTGVQDGAANLYIVDVMGRVLINKPIVLHGGNDTINITMDSVPGVYVASLLTPAGTRMSKKFYK